METRKLIEEMKKLNKETLIKLLENIMHLIIELKKIEDEKEKEEITNLLINSIALVIWNIKTL